MHGKFSTMRRCGEIRGHFARKDLSAPPDISWMIYGKSKLPLSVQIKRVLLQHQPRIRPRESCYCNKLELDLESLVTAKDEN